MTPKTDRLVVPVGATGQRLDRHIANQLSSLSRSQTVRLIQSRNVTVDGHLRDPDYRVSPGETILVFVADTHESLTPDPTPLGILLETPGIAVINKPAGLVMHPGVGNEAGTLAHRLVAHYPTLADVGHPRRPGIVHRLDRETSGVVLVARTTEAYHLLQTAFERREVKKTYLAIVRGRPAVETARIDAPIGRHPTHRTHMAVRRGGREALTEYQLLTSTRDASLLEVRPKTGRTHQIRVHLVSIGHPILGDSRYGPKCPKPGRALLHAWQLEFTDSEGRRWRVAAAPPDDMREAASELGLEVPATPTTELVSS